MFETIARVVNTGRLGPSDIEVRLVGNVWLGADPTSSLPYRVTTVGYVPHGEAIQEMRSAGALVFFQPDDYEGSSGKIFEYLVAGRPILCVANRSNLASRLVEEFDAGVVVEPGDALGIEESICALHTRWAEGSLSISPRVRDRALERFSRRSLTRRLDEVLTAAVVGGRAPSDTPAPEPDRYLQSSPVFEPRPDH